MADSGNNRAKQQTGRIAARTARMQRLNRASKPRAPKKAKAPQELAFTFPQFARLPVELQTMVFEFAFHDWMSHHGKTRTYDKPISEFTIRRSVPTPHFGPYNPTLGIRLRIPVPIFRLDIQCQQDDDFDETVFFCLFSARKVCAWAPLQTCHLFRKVTLGMIKRQEWPANFDDHSGRYKSIVFKQMAPSKYTAEHRNWRSKRRPVFLEEGEELEVEETVMEYTRARLFKPRIVKKAETYGVE